MSVVVRTLTLTHVIRRMLAMAEELQAGVKLIQKRKRKKKDHDNGTDS